MFFVTRGRAARRDDIFPKSAKWHIPHKWGNGAGSKLYQLLDLNSPNELRLREWAKHTMCDALLLLHA